MAFFDTTARAPFASGNSLFSNLYAAMQRRRKMRQTYAELSVLGERELEDLGLTRGDLPDIARRSAGLQ